MIIAILLVLIDDFLLVLHTVLRLFYSDVVIAWMAPCAKSALCASSFFCQLFALDHLGVDEEHWKCA